MRKSILALPLIAAIPLLALAAPKKAHHEGHMDMAAVDVSKILAGSYTADVNHTLVGWRVNHLSINDYFGIFGDISGKLELDPKNPNGAKVSMTIPVSKVITASAGLTEHMLRAGKDGAKPDFFGPNPADATFVSTSVAAKGQQAKIIGNLTVNGITKPVTLDAVLVGAGKPPFPGAKDSIGFHAKALIKRSDFGIDGGIPFVSDKVELDISAAFEKAG